MKTLIDKTAEGLARDGVVRVVNYHNTPASLASVYEREFSALAANFSPVNEDDLARYLSTGRWDKEKPGVIPAFYNGYRNNYDVALPLLEKHGLTGWFFAVSGYSSCPSSEQLAYGSQRTLATMKDEYADGRYALSWDELRSLDKAHVVASHTRNHTRVSLEDRTRVQDEIVGSQEDFRRELGHPVRSFAWLFGGRYGENPIADTAVDAAGYELLFSNLNVQRLRTHSI